MTKFIRIILIVVSLLIFSNTVVLAKDALFFNPEYHLLTATEEKPGFTEMTLLYNRVQNIHIFVEPEYYDYYIAKGWTEDVYDEETTVVTFFSGIGTTAKGSANYKLRETLLTGSWDNSANHFFYRILETGYYWTPDIIVHNKNGDKQFIPLTALKQYEKEGWSTKFSTLKDYIYMYSPDGRRTFINEKDAEQFEKSGWFTGEIVTMHSENGETSVVNISEATQLKAKGWKSDSYKTLYAPDGRTETVHYTDVETWKSVGWFTSKPVLLYAADGRTIYVGADDIEEWKKVGWYTEQVVTVYAADGRTLVIPTSQIEAYKAVGWYYTITMYAPDGRTSEVLYPDVQAWKNVGWYTEPVTTVYAADGRTLVIPISQIDAYKAVGWLTEEQYKLTRLDDYAAMTIYDAIYRESKIPPNYNLNSVYVKLDQEKYFYAVIGYSFESGFGTTHTEGIIKGLNPDSGKISEDFISIYKDLVEKGEDNYKRALENASKYPYDRIWAILLESSEKSLPNTKAQLAEYQAWLLSPASYGFQKLDANHIKNLVSSIQQ